MSINSDIKFWISESGNYCLDFIPENQIERYLNRLNNYITSWEICNYRLRDGKVVCKITFLEIEDSLRDKLENAYGLLDKRKPSLPISESITYLRMSPSSLFVHARQNKDVSAIKKYLNQYKEIQYLCGYPASGTIYRMWNIPQKTNLEVNKYIEDICLKDPNWNEKIELLKYQEMIEQYCLNDSYEMNRPVFTPFSLWGY